MKISPYDRDRLLPLLLGCHEFEALQGVSKKAKIELKRPPNFDAIVKVFPSAASPSVLFTYGDTIYNPTGLTISPALIAHECTHIVQQEEMGADAWWALYLKSVPFRFRNELDAYRLEHRMYNTYNNRHFRKRYLRSCAERLSGPLYNHCCKRRLAETLVAMETDNEIANRSEREKDLSSRDWAA